MKNINNRTTQYDINDIFLKRYSPRAMSGEAVSKDDLMTMFDAARWAPSASNNQPWRFLYTMNGTKEFELFFSFLKGGNQIWCKNAGALIILLSKKISDEGKENPYHAFDTASAWENFALQGGELGLVVHGMAGYEMDLLKKGLNLSDEYAPQIMIAVGKHGNIQDLPEKLREREQPNERKNLDELVFEGNLH